MTSWRAKARPKQIQPKDYKIWLIQTGRGFGKNWAAANNLIENIQTGKWRHTALVGSSAADVRDLMIDPDKKNSGIMKCAENSFYPKYEPSKRQIVWPNGAICTAYSAEDSDQLRGPSHDSFWCDELAAWNKNTREPTWSNLMFTLRLGKSQGIITTTPRPILLLKHIRALSGTVITTGSTYENKDNLSDTYINGVVRTYEGTRIGRQELMGELLEDNDAALFDMNTIDANRVIPDDNTPPICDVIVVGVDPTGSKDGHGVGIIIGGKIGTIGYLLADYSMPSASPNDWALKTIKAYDDFEANYVVVENNFGGEMVANTIRLIAKTIDHSPISIKEVHASRGKLIRAEPVSGLVQQGRIKHYGVFGALEDELYALESGQSDDRADAYVWAFTDLLVQHIKRYKPFAGNAKIIRNDMASTSIIGNVWNKVF